MTLSFIIPVYNVAPYLRKCVDSLLNQDYNDYEIILVDDGSTDDSWQIIQEYVSRLRGLEDERIRGIHQENGGLSAARNTGIKAAKGEYICFVDSDDYWEPNVLGRLMEQVQREQLDVLRFDYQNVRIGKNEEYEVFEPNKDPKRDVDFSEEVTDGETFLNERLGPACYAVMFIIRRGLILSSHRHISSCLFRDGIFFEDVDWTPRMLLRANRAASTEKVVYNYLRRTGSITLPSDSAKRKKTVEDRIRLIHGFQEQSKFAQNPKWFIWMTSNLTIGVLSAISDMPKYERDAYIKELQSFHIFPLSIQKEKMLSCRLRIMIANISPYLYCLIMKIKK